MIRELAILAGMVYVAGFAVAHRLAYLDWREDFGPEFQGFVWAILVALPWPILAPVYLAWRLTK